MKKILSLVLAVFIIMAMAIPAFAVSENEIAPCAVCTGNHTAGDTIRVEINYAHITSGAGKNCCRITTTYYECSVCHKIFSQVTATGYYNHVKKLVHASCNGSVQTLKYNCKNCGGYYYTDYDVPCPGADHIPGNCHWLPI